ncbi:MAG TPA: hypothetical protein VN317_09665, partial [Candidatus Methanoperedens sp.]|nr:hypothetical protein [Candidatus Methanoperedens sp.]
MTLRSRALFAATLLLGISLTSAWVIVSSLRDIIDNQRIIVFKDEMFHDHERARGLIQSSLMRLYQHQAGYTRDIDRLVDDIANFEALALSIVPHYRQRLRVEDCTDCHQDAQTQIDLLDEEVRAMLIDLDRYRESVSIIITTNDRQARLLQHGVASARGEQIVAAIQKVNANTARMVDQLRVRNERLLNRSALVIQGVLLLVGVTFTLILAYAFFALNRTFVSLLRGTDSVARDDFSHRLTLAARRDEIGLLAQ